MQNCLHRAETSGVHPAINTHHIHRLQGKREREKTTWILQFDHSLLSFWQRTNYFQLLTEESAGCHNLQCLYNTWNGAIECMGQQANQMRAGHIVKGAALTLIFLYEKERNTKTKQCKASDMTSGGTFFPPGVSFNCYLIHLLNFSSQQTLDQGSQSVQVGFSKEFFVWTLLANEVHTHKNPYTPCLCGTCIAQLCWKIKANCQRNLELFIHGILKKNNGTFHATTVLSSCSLPVNWF